VTTKESKKKATGGPILVERQRRTQNTDVPVMQKSMELKQKNL
jgi:hypothetical protein